MVIVIYTYHIKSIIKGKWLLFPYVSLRLISPVYSVTLTGLKTEVNSIQKLKMNVKNWDLLYGLFFLAILVMVHTVLVDNYARSRETQR